MIEIFFNALLTLFLLSFLTGPMGSLAIGQRVSYLGDAVSHGSLLGMALALGMGISPLFGALLISLLIGLYLGGIDQRREGLDSNLVLIAYGGLAAALIAATIFGLRIIQLEAFLFGDPFTIRTSLLIELFVLTFLVLSLLYWRWKKILLVTISPALAAASGIDVVFERRFFITLLAMTVTIAASAIGVLLVGALLIIPALSSRHFTRSPEGMAMLASVISFFSGIIGLVFAWVWDLPASPAIVISALIIFLLTKIILWRYPQK